MDKQHPSREPEHLCNCNGEAKQHQAEPAEHGPRDSEMYSDEVYIAMGQKRYEALKLSSKVLWEEVCAKVFNREFNDR